jgi:hypothetical protein
MIRSVVSVAVIAVVLVVGMLLLRPHSQSIELTTAAMPSLEELHVTAGVHQLPDQDIDDQSLIFPPKTKQ